MITPAYYDLPFPKFRQHQLEAIQEITSIPEKPTQTMIVSAPTGSGKSSFAGACARDHRVIALSHTKLLQQDNYGEQLDFVYLFGKGNYTCAKDSSRRADMCLRKNDPQLCEHYQECGYFVKKRAAMTAQKTALNYAYFLSTRWPKAQAPSSFLFLDECHLVPNLVVEHSSITITEKDRRDWALPEFPTVGRNNTQSMMFKNLATPEDKALEWLKQSELHMSMVVSELEKTYRYPNREQQKEITTASRLQLRLSSVLESLEEAPKDWFIRSGPGAIARHDHHIPGFVCKPLTARHHFPRLLIFGGPTVLMSATIGNFETFANELGISEYNTLAVPSIWKPELRPVYYHKDAPKIGRSTKPAGYEKQADIITKMLNDVPDDWEGVIHTTSKSQAQSLLVRLAQRGLSQRIWMPPFKGTNYQLEAWQHEKKRRKGAIAVAWSWWTGTDLRDEKISLMAKTPFGYCGDDYTRSRMHYDGKFYLQQTAWQLQQGAGRTRRGRAQDYGKDNGLVGVVDGNWTRVKNYFDQDFQEAMTEW